MLLSSQGLDTFGFCPDLSSSKCSLASSQEQQPRLNSVDSGVFSLSNADIPYHNSSINLPLSVNGRCIDEDSWRTEGIHGDHVACRKFSVGNIKLVKDGEPIECPSFQEKKMDKIYKSLPCRSHHKLNLHSLKLQQLLSCPKSRPSCLNNGEYGESSGCLSISPVMELYMESTNPALKEYMEQVRKLSAGITMESCNTSSGCSKRPSLASLPEVPKCVNECRQCHDTVIDVDNDDCETSEEETESAYHLKPSIDNDVKKLKLQVWTDIVRSCFRNFCCYLALGILILLCFNGRDFMMMSIWQKVVPLLLLCIGLSGVPLQVIHGMTEFRCRSKRTVIAQMLNERTKQLGGFIKMIHNRQMSAPYISVELKVKHRVKVKSHVKDEEEEMEMKHWSKLSKRMAKMLVYNDWFDRSASTDNIKWRAGCANWIIVAKDYQTANHSTELSVQEDMMDFGCDASVNVPEMKRSVLLDVVEGEAYPDAQAFLVCPDAGRSRFYTFSTYKLMLLMGLDSLYNIAFHIATKRVGRYNIVKVIAR